MRTVWAFLGAIVVTSAWRYLSQVLDARAQAWHTELWLPGGRVVADTAHWLSLWWPLGSMALLPAIVGFAAVAGLRLKPGADYRRRDRLHALACWIGIAASSGPLLIAIVLLTRPEQLNDWVFVPLVLLENAVPTSLVTMVVYAALVQNGVRRAGMSRFDGWDVVVASSVVALAASLSLVPRALVSTLAALPPAWVWWRARALGEVESGG